MLLATYFVAAYLMGSVPFAVWIGKAFYAVDVRSQGSGNAGATNVFRVLGKKAGIPVLLLDVLKGAAAAALILITPAIVSPANLILVEIGLGATAVIGHIYPVFAGFKGGKGVATLLGFVFVLQWQVAVLCVTVFLLVLLTFHFVSLASILAALSYPVFLLTVMKDPPAALTWFGLVAALLVIYTHRKNIGRLLAGTESRVYLIKKK